MSDKHPHRDAFDWKGTKATRVAEVTLALADPPPRGKPGEPDYLNDLLDAAGPMGWRWSVLNMETLPRRGAAAPEPYNAVATALQEMKDEIDGVLDLFTEVAGQEPDRRLWHDVATSVSRLAHAGVRLERLTDDVPEPEEHDDDDA